MVYFKGKQTRLLETASYVDLILSYEQNSICEHFILQHIYQCYHSIHDSLLLKDWKYMICLHLQKKWNIAVYKNWDRCGSRSINTL